MSKMLPRLLILLSLLLIPLSLSANPVMVNWVAYSPSDSWQPGQVAESSLVWRDLEVLQGFGFIGLATYGTLDSLCVVPRLARRLGFEYVVMGVWIGEDTAANRQGIDLAIEYHADADAICVGNEALFLGRADTSYLGWAMDTIRAATGKPVTTSEHWTMYSNPGYGPWLLRNCDFLFPILNPTDNGIYDPDSGVLWVMDQLASVKAMAGESLGVLVREAGWPTNSDSASQRAWANETNQYLFLGQLRSWFAWDTLYFCCEAFDGWWKNWDPTQPYWGLFDSERLPKLYAGGLGIEASPGHAPGRPESDAPAGTLLGLSPGPLGLYDLAGRRAPTGRTKTGVHFLKTRQGHFRKTLVVR
jgi:exo-beta-1,3-glucanase (GH17 family)